MTHTKEQAIKHLKTIDQGTVIDDSYYDYFWHEENWDTLEALKTLTGLPNYQTIHRDFEGYTISELIFFFDPKVYNHTVGLDRAEHWKVKSPFSKQ